MKFRWTLNLKIQILIAVVLISVFALTQIGMSGFIRQNVRDNFETNVVNTSKLLQNSIEIIFNDANNSLEHLDRTYRGSEGAIDEILGSMNTLVESKDYILNGFIVYEDGSYGISPTADLPSDFDPREMSWYKSSVGTNTIMWSQPYVDIATGEMVITGSKAIAFKDKNGALGVDIRLSKLPDVINTTQVSNNSFFMLVNSNGFIITDSKNYYIGNTINSLEDEELVSSKLITGKLETDKGIYYARRLERTNIRLIAFLPNEDIVTEIKNITSGSRIFVMVALFIGIIVASFFTRRLTRPILQLTKVMEESRQTDELIQLDLESKDELGTLIDGYNNLANHVNSQNQKLTKLSENLMESERRLQEQYDVASKMAFLDHLTNLPNRVKFEEHIQDLIHEGIPFALYYIDLDNFKYINDTYGHNYGDMVLQAISRRLEKLVKENFFASRLSGDEFGVIVSNIAERKDLYVLARYMLDTLSSSISIDELEFSVTGSIGISLYPEDGVTFEELLSNADIAMYEAKNNLKNQYTIFNPSLRKKMINRVKIETNLFSAIEKDELYLCYQPIYTFDNNEIKGFEALVRWDSEVLGMVYPDVFIPIAEHNLFINKLGYHVLEKAIVFSKHLYKTYGRYFEMNVNVSTVQLHIEGFVEDVFEILDRHHYPYEYLNLEVTESLALETDTNVHKKLSKLRRRGVKISLDDFGTGYSSINHLINLSLSHLKIDRMVIQEATKNEEVFKLIRGIVDFAHAVELKVVAEGIEDQYMEDLMREMKVDFAQGYLYSKPQKEEFIIELLKEDA